MRETHTNETVKQKLKNAISSKDKTTFNLLLQEYSDFSTVFDMAIECATLTSNDLIYKDMMASCLTRMTVLNNQNWVAVLGNDASRITACLNVIEAHDDLSDPKKSKSILQNAQLRSLLLSAFPKAIYPNHFPKISKFYFKSHAHGELRLFLTNTRDIACRTRNFDDFFNLVDLCETSKLIGKGAISGLCGEFMELFFHAWCTVKRKAKESRENSIVIPRKALNRLSVFRTILANENAFDVITVCRNRSSFVDLFTRACNQGNVPFLLELLEVGANPNERDKSGRTPLYLAARNGYIEIVRLLLEKGADPNMACGESHSAIAEPGRTPLHAAATHLTSDMVQLLLDSGANINSYYGFGVTPLCIALAKGDCDTARTLLTNGAKITHSVEMNVRGNAAASALLEQTKKERAEKAQRKQEATTLLAFGKYKRGIFASEKLEQLREDTVQLIGKMIKASSAAA